MMQLWKNSVVWRGLTAMSIMRYVTKGMTLVRLLFVARWLGPGQLGTVGLAFLMLAISEVFTETGINLVLLKHPKKLNEYLDTAWTISLVRGGLIALLLVLSSSVVAGIYNDPALPIYILVGALIPLIRGFIHPAIIRFQQDLQFGRESGFRLFLQVIDIAVGAYFVWQWQSALGLIVGVVVSAVVELICSFVLFHPWPSFGKLQLKNLKSLYKEARFMLPHSVFSYLSEHADDFTVGKLLGTTGLGIYQTAYKFVSAITLDLSAIVGQTLYPIYARKIAKKESVYSLWLKATLGLLGTFTLMLIPLLIIFPPLILKALGETWKDIVPILPILFIACAIKAILSSWNPLVILADKTGGLVIVNALIMFIMVGGIIWLTPTLGLQGVVLAVLAAMLTSVPYNWWLLRKSLYSLRQ